MFGTHVVLKSHSLSPYLYLSLSLSPTHTNSLTHTHTHYLPLTHTHSLSLSSLPHTLTLSPSHTCYLSLPFSIFLGDLKPANFVFVKGHLKLIDFGIAKAFSNDTTNIYRQSQIGTVSQKSSKCNYFLDFHYSYDMKFESFFQ